MLAPKKVKHRKWQVGRKHPDKLARPDSRGVTMAFGTFGLKAMEPYRLTSNQLEAARRALSRAAGKTAKIWIRVFPDRPFTRKPAEVRMGSGKGDLQGYVVEVRPGRVLFEVDGTPEAAAREALRKAGKKLPIKVRIVARA